MMTITINTALPPERIAAALAEVVREGAQRRAVYPRMVEGGKLSQQAADKRIAGLQDAWRILSAVASVLGVETAPTTPEPVPEPEPELGLTPRCRLCGSAGRIVPAPHWGSSLHTYYECSNDDCAYSIATVSHAFAAHTPQETTP